LALLVTNAFRRAGHTPERFVLERLRRNLNAGFGRGIAAAVVVVVVAATAYGVAAYLRGETPASARERMYICTETGKPFAHEPQRGETLPIASPHSGKDTGVPAEACYWTADGGTKPEPTWVLLNESAKRPGPTFCPDCGRLVVGHNPEPAAGATPPPKQADYKPREPRKLAPSRDGR
jgi:hypothetical protein